MARSGDPGGLPSSAWSTGARAGSAPSNRGRGFLFFRRSRMCALFGSLYYCILVIMLIDQNIGRESAQTLMSFVSGRRQPAPRAPQAPHLHTFPPACRLPCPVLSPLTPRRLGCSRAARSSPCDPCFWLPSLGVWLRIAAVLTWQEPVWLRVTCCSVT